MRRIHLKRISKHIASKATEVGREKANGSGIIHRLEDLDLDLVPKDLSTQCRSLIESYHEVHGSACLPDILWKFGLGPFIERHRELRQSLRKASTTRSAKKSDEGFVHIATTILALEILASCFASWGAFHPRAAELARAILRGYGLGTRMPLMEFYLYPPKYISSATLATIAPPTDRHAWEAASYRRSDLELSDELSTASKFDSKKLPAE